MKNIINALNNIEEKIISILLPLMCLVIFLSTVFRFTKLLIIPWGEELARYLMVWLVFLGIACGAKNNKHFGVEVFVKALIPEKAQKYYEIFRVLVISAFMFFVIITMSQLMQLQVQMKQTSPSLGIPMWMVYLAIPVGCGLMILRQIQYTWIRIKEK